MGAFEDVQKAVNSALPFEQIEQKIDSIEEISDDEKAALWLVAFSFQDRPIREQVIREAVVALNRAQG